LSRKKNKSPIRPARIRRPETEEEQNKTPEPAEDAPQAGEDLPDIIEALTGPGAAGLFGDGEDMTGPAPSDIPQTLPVLAVRDIVVFNYMILPLFVGREKSVQAVDAALSGDRYILILTQKDESVEDPAPDDLYETGTVGMIMRMLKMPDGTAASRSWSRGWRGPRSSGSRPASPTTSPSSSRSWSPTPDG